MKLEFKNINPCNLLDKIIENGIKVEDVLVTSDIKLGQNTANNVNVETKDEYIEKIKNIAENLDNSAKIKSSEQEKLLSLVLLENAEIKRQLKEQQELSASLGLQIAELKGGNKNV